VSRTTDTRKRKKEEEEANQRKDRQQSMEVKEAENRTEVSSLEQTWLLPSSSRDKISWSSMSLLLFLWLLSLWDRELHHYHCWEFLFFPCLRYFCRCITRSRFEETTYTQNEGVMMERAWDDNIKKETRKLI
jgi:hypothetical protein